MSETGNFIPLSETGFAHNENVDSFESVRDRNFKINPDVLPLISKREHMARPYPGGNFNFLAVNVPSTYQQGLIPDGEELPHGLLRIVSAANNLHSVSSNYPKLNTGILDAHRLRLQPEKIAEQIKKTTTGIVGLNPTSVNVPEAQKIAELCDIMGIPYILGGIHATLDPLLARLDFPNVAAIVRGNGELVINHLVQGLLEGNQPELRGVHYAHKNTYREDYALNLNPQDIPMVRQDILAEEPVFRHTVVINGEGKEINEANLFVTQGCPFECTFCSSPVMVNRVGKDGNKPYDRPEMKRIIQEIEHVVSDLGADAIHFLDDMAFVTKEHIDDLHSGLQDRSIMGKFIWRGLTRAPIITRFDDKTMDKMKETGAWKIALGVESGSNEILRQIKKKVTTEDVIAAVQKLSRYGIQAKGFFIFGFPGETEAQILKTRDLIQYLKGIGMTEIAAFQFKPYPGTEAFRDLVKKRPDILKRLTYLRRSGLSNEERVRFRAEQHDTWLPEDLSIASIPSGKVQEHVIGALEDFYGTTIASSRSDSSCT
jgi:anaerobic magnesium-protoporphyrin IX monomethyl ester cyclase